jgi:hypothetical protein
MGRPLKIGSQKWCETYGTNSLKQDRKIQFKSITKPKLAFVRPATKSNTSKVKAKTIKKTKTKIEKPSKIKIIATSDEIVSDNEIEIVEKSNKRFIESNKRVARLTFILKF